MIGRLRGTLVALRPTAVVLDVAGVGYEVVVTPRSVAQLPTVGEEVVVHTHLVVREDALVIHGFGSEAERDLFRVLLTASGVGPKVAMATLGALQPDEFRRAIAAEDIDTLTISVRDVSGKCPKSYQEAFAGWDDGVFSKTVRTIESE